MEPFRGQFTLPRLERVIAGPGTLSRLADELDRYDCRRAVVVTGATVAASPLLGRLRETLQHRCAAVFSGARQHVPAATIVSLLRTLRDVAADSLVSVGGGSPIDTAKAAVHALLGEAATPSTCLPVHIAIPTTLSAGEFTDVAGVTDESTRRKHPVADPAIAPRTVVADALVTLDTPDWLWAASGIRALDHAVETLYSSRPHPLTEPLAARAIAMLVEHLPASLAAGDGRVAHRGECQMAAWLAVFGVTNAGFGLSHALGHQIGPRWHVLHGATSAIVLPHVMRFMADRAPLRFAHIARSFGVAFDASDPRPGARGCADYAAAFIGRLPVPTRLRDVGVPREELTEIAAFVADTMQRTGAIERRVTADDITAVLAAAH